MSNSGKVKTIREHVDNIRRLIAERAAISPDAPHDKVSGKCLACRRDNLMGDIDYAKIDLADAMLAADVKECEHIVILSGVASSDGKLLVHSCFCVKRGSQLSYRAENKTVYVTAPVGAGTIPEQSADRAGVSPNAVREIVYCLLCHKDHAVLPDETPCGEGAWVEVTSWRRGGGR